MRDRDDGGTGWVDVMSQEHGQGEACNGLAFVAIPDDPPSRIAGMSYLVRCDDESHDHKFVVCTSPDGNRRIFDIRESHPHGDERPFLGLSRLWPKRKFETYRVPQLQRLHALAGDSPWESPHEPPPKAPGGFDVPVGAALAGQVESTVLGQVGKWDAPRQREPGDDDDEPLPWEKGYAAEG